MEAGNWLHYLFEPYNHFITVPLNRKYEIEIILCNYFMHNDCL